MANGLSYDDSLTSGSLKNTIVLFINNITLEVKETLIAMIKFPLITSIDFITVSSKPTVYL